MTSPIYVFYHTKSDLLDPSENATSNDKLRGELGVRVDDDDVFN